MLRKKLIAIMVAGVIGMAICSGSGSALAHEEHEAGQAAQKKGELCPVTGEKADSNGVSYEYKGKTYHFCCASCLTDFKKDPEKYIRKMNDDAAKAKEHDHHE